MGLRQDKFERLMQKDLGEIFQRKSSDWFGGAFITVSETTVTPDLLYVKVYLSLFNVKDKDKLMEEIELRSKEIRKILASKIRNSVRKIPELQYFEDNSLEEMNKMDALFDQIKKERTDKENKEKK